MFFSESFFRSFVLEASGLYFSWIWGVVWWYFLMFFFCVSGASITKENVVLIEYLLCSKHIYLFEKGEQVYKFDTFLRTHLGAALGVDFRRIWDRFWELFGTLKAPQYGKGRSEQTVEKQTNIKKTRKTSTQAENGHAGRVHVLP